MPQGINNSYDFYQQSPQNIPPDIGVTSQEQKFTPPQRDVNDQMDTKNPVGIS